jgi:4a-hydroxytetrahydrobiopterin dehydratase
MRARRRGPRSDYLSDALALLGGWTRDGVQLKRELACDDSQHAALTERIKVAADTLHIRPSIRRVSTVTHRSAGRPTARPSPTVR